MRAAAGCGGHRPGRRQLPGAGRYWRSALVLVALVALAVANAAGAAAAQGAASGPMATTVDDGHTPIVWTDADCRSCHELKQPIFSHPVDVRPSMPVPDFLPLENNQLACTTCHLDDATTHARSRSTHDGMLRTGLTDRAFCRQCHNGSTSGDTSAHAALLDRAHLPWEDRRSTGSSAFSSPLGTTSDPDRAARDCLGCHDGAIGPQIGNSHPTGIRYMVGVRRGSRAGRDSTLTSAERLDPRIRLFNNKVECQSCHSPYSKRAKLLVVANDRSQMCRSCHNRH